MRTKKTYIVLSFRTTVEAMAWEKHCATAQIPGRLIPLPREISAGCGLAWRRRIGNTGTACWTRRLTTRCRRWSNDEQENIL